MNEIKWIKLTTDMFDNRKIKHLRRLPEGNNIVLIWVMLLTMAGRCNAGGMIFLTENIPYTPKMLADELDFEENTVVLALKALAELGMVSQSGTFLAIDGWEEHQNVESLDRIREQNRARQAKFKASRRKDLTSNVIGNVTLTLGNATDKDKEEEKEIERENNKAAKPTFDEILSEIEGEDLRQTYRDYIEMRKAIKAPMTERALRTLISKVDSLETSSDGKCSLLETAILNNWKSVYAPKEDQKQNPRNPRAKTRSATTEELNDVYWDIVDAE